MQLEHTLTTKSFAQQNHISYMLMQPQLQLPTLGPQGPYCWCVPSHDVHWANLPISSTQYVCLCVTGARADANGAQSFWATAPQGSWQINLPNAGHMSFLDYDPATDPGSAPLLVSTHVLPF